MFRHYLLNAYRNLLRNPVYTIINVGGLAIGLAACILILMWVRDELSYDRYFPDANRIYRVIYQDIRLTQPRTPHPLPLAMAADFPEVENGVSISPLWGVGLTRPEHTVKYLNKRFEEKEFLSADSTFFKIFPLSFVEGNQADALKIPFGLVITQSIARKYFGKEMALGKTIEVDGDVNLTVTGVTCDLPHNTHFTYDFLISYVTLKAMDIKRNEGVLSDYYTWNDFGHFNYILLAPGSNPTLIGNKIMQWIPAYINFTPEILEQIKKYHIELALQPLTEIHLHSHMIWELGNNGDILYVYAFSATALLILIIAIFNFMNLSTARNEKRAHEAGVRKTLGAFRGQLIIQFMGESLLLTLISVFLAAIIVELCLPAFSSFTGKNFDWILSDRAFNIVLLFMIAVSVGLLTGTYPSFYLTAFVPVHFLKGKTVTTLSQVTLRKVLVILQFAISIFLIIATLGIADQIRYIQNKNLGFNKSNVLVIPLRSNQIRNQFSAFRQTLMQNAGIVNISGVSNILGGQFNNNGIYWKDPQQSINASEMWVDDEFFKLMGMDITAGKAFSSEFTSDSTASFILNQKACRELNLEDPVGEMITWEGDYPGTIHGKIIGVVKDFNFKSLHEDIAPLIIQRITRSRLMTYLIIRLQSNDLSGTIKFIEKTWKQFEPDLGFEYSFLDEDYEKLYDAEEKMAYLFRIFTLLGIFIACLGLLGLSGYLAEQRTKEIGIRKAHGSSSRQVFMLLNREITYQILISSLISWPVTWLVLHRWLRNYPYHVDINLFFFFIATITAAIITILVTGYQSLSASRKNPVDSLRYE